MNNIGFMVKCLIIYEIIIVVNHKNLWRDSISIGNYQKILMTLSFETLAHKQLCKLSCSLSEYL